jgi:hypothetical protein
MPNIVDAESELGKQILGSKFPEHVAQAMGVDGISATSKLAGFTGRPETVIYNQSVAQLCVRRQHAMGLAIPGERLKRQRSL